MNLRVKLLHPDVSPPTVCPNDGAAYTLYSPSPLAFYPGLHKVPMKISFDLPPNVIAVLSPLPDILDRKVAIQHGVIDHAKNGQELCIWIQVPPNKSFLRKIGEPLMHMVLQPYHQQGDVTLVKD